MPLNDMLTKRLLKEFEELKKYKNMEKIELIFPGNNNDLFKNICFYNLSNNAPYIKIKINNNNLILAVPSQYPFRPPVLIINNINFREYYKIKYNNVFLQEMRNELKRKYNMNCLCCETLMCIGSGKWSPSIHLTRILDEYKKFQDIKCYLNTFSILLDINKQINYKLPLEIIETISNFI